MMSKLTLDFASWKRAQISSGKIMIRRDLISRLTNLETRYAAAVQAKRDKVNAPLRHARWHAVEVAAVALYGEPKIEEPLRIAQSRMQEKLDKEFAAAAEEWWMHAEDEDGEDEDEEELTPIMARILYPTLMFNNLRGGNNNLKFERIFSEAPAWLLKFTAVEWDAKLLGFKLRKLVGTPELGRIARLDRNNWPSLPMGTIDAGGPCSEPDEPWKKIVERRCHELPVPTEPSRSE
jgi:hypothetical protein